MHEQRESLSLHVVGVFARVPLGPRLWQSSPQPGPLGGPRVPWLVQVDRDSEAEILLKVVLAFIVNHPTFSSQIPEMPYEITHETFRYFLPSLHFRYNLILLS